MLFATSVAGQVHKDEIIKFVDENKGKKVGTGYCYELVQGAIQTYNPSYEMCYIKKDSDRYGKKIKSSDALVGDIIVLDGGTKRKASHVCIIYDIDGEDIWVAEQNTKGNLKKSIVVVNLLNYEWDEEYYGKVRYNFYRPQ